MHEILPFAEVRDLIFRQGHDYLDLGERSKKIAEDESRTLGWLSAETRQEIERT